MTAWSDSAEQGHRMTIYPAATREPAENDGEANPAVTVGGRLPNSLLFKAVAGVVLIISLVIAVMSLSVHWFVSAQFSHLNQQRNLERIGRLGQQLVSEQEALAAVARLISTDSDLRQSLQYHLSLQGEQRPLAADVARIASTFRFSLLGVWDTAGNLVLLSDPRYLEVIRGLDFVRGSEPRLIWHDERLWGAVNVPVLVNDTPIAFIAMIQQVSTTGEEIGILREQSGDQDREEKRGMYSIPLDVPVFSTDGRKIPIELLIVDSVVDALEMTRRVVGLTLAGAALLLIMASVYYLRRILDPVRELTHAAVLLPSRLERGEFEPIQVQADGEVAALREAFNEMFRKLVRLRALEEELRQQEKLSAIGRVALRIAHDINNPLSVIKNTARLMESSAGRTEDDKQDLQLIVRHCNRCASTIENLLRIGKPVRLHAEMLELDTCMEEFLQGVRQRHPNAPIEYTPSVNGLMLRGDRDQLANLLDNLVENGLKANGGQRITIDVGMESGRVYLKITDYGRGFTEEEAARAFDIFYTRTAGGTGLGLPNARAIARAHGGDVVISNPALGELTVWLAARQQA